MSDVQSLLECVQQLVDSRPSDGCTVEWCVKAAHIGYVNALSAAAIRAARYASSREPERAASRRMNSGAYSCPSLKPPTFDTISAADRLSVIACCVRPRVVVC